MITAFTASVPVNWLIAAGVIAAPLRQEYWLGDWATLPSLLYQAPRPVRMIGNSVVPDDLRSLSDRIATGTPGAHHTQTIVLCFGEARAEDARHLAARLQIAKREPNLAGVVPQLITSEVVLSSRGLNAVRDNSPGESCRSR